MSDAQDKIKKLYQEIKQSEKEKKELNATIKEAFEGLKQYQDLMDEMNILKAKKKQIEVGVRDEYSSEFNQLEDLKMDVKDSKQVLSDLMWNELMKNNKVEVEDEYDNKYVPQVSVTLKKLG